MLENEDIQHILLTRTPALTGRYEFLSFRNAAGGRAWLSAIREKAQSAAEVLASVEKDKRWVTVAFTWNGLRALGVDEGSLATFPEVSAPFREVTFCASYKCHCFGVKGSRLSWFRG
jgi:hypothetical protein